MGYPKSVLTKNRKGETEVRGLLDRGRYVRYNYINPDTGKIMENGKFSIILKDEKGGRSGHGAAERPLSGLAGSSASSRGGRQDEHYFMIPLKGRWMAILDKGNKLRKVWNEKESKAEDA